MATDTPTTPDPVRGLRDAAELVVGCARAGIELHDAHGGTSKLSPGLAVPIAKVLRQAADAVEQHDTVNAASMPAGELALAVAILGEDLAGEAR